ncbi:unnamed protein product, partial [Ectocarpus fasciculatus]
MASRHKLSKSTYTYGRQCLKRLYLHKNHTRLGVAKDKQSASLQSRFLLGTEVGTLAQAYFPGGLDCTPANTLDFGPSLALTSAAIDQGSHSVIYEACFQAEDVLVALDILVRREDGWHGYEVKSTKSVEPQHVTDAALQYWVIQRSGLPLLSMNIMHLSGHFVRDSEPIDVNKLFSTIDITEKVLEEQAVIAENVERQMSCLDIEDTVPDVRIGKHCTTPYPCDFMKHCWKQANVPEYSVLNLSRGGAKSWRLYYEGVEHIKDIGDGTPLSPTQKLQVECDKSGRAHIDVVSLAEFVAGVTYPIHYLDFETIAPPVPLFANSRCYQAITFQYSLHTQYSPFSDSFFSDDPALLHTDFIGDGTAADPRQPLLARLLEDIGDTGCVMVYNKSFEDARLKEMSVDFPEFAERIDHIRSRLVDLAIPFQKKHYYTPSMKGKYSIKQVLPAVCPQYLNSYTDLDIQEGMAASNTYMSMIGSEDTTTKETELKNLLEYCKLDTLAMVKIYEVICRLV